HRWGGLQGIRELKQLDAGLDDPRQLQALADQLREIHRLMLAAPRQGLLVAEPEQLDAFQARFLAALSPCPATDHLGFSRPALCEPSNQLWTTGTQVNF